MSGLRVVTQRVIREAEPGALAAVSVISTCDATGLVVVGHTDGRVSLYQCCHPQEAANSNGAAPEPSVAYRLIAHMHHHRNAVRYIYLFQNQRSVYMRALGSLLHCIHMFDTFRKTYRVLLLLVQSIEWATTAQIHLHS